MSGFRRKVGLGRNGEVPRGNRGSVRKRAGFVLLSLLILGLGLVVFTAVGGAGRGDDLEPQRGPINPDFLRYLEEVKEGRTPDLADDGHRLGDIPPLIDFSHTRGARLASRFEAFPASYDLRTLGKLTSVKDQGDCGSCWSFATMGGLESYLLPTETWDFSEQNLIDLHGFDWLPCAGGNAWMSAAYLSRWSGPLDEADDPYIYADLTAETKKHVQNVIFLPNRSGPTDNDAIKQAVMTYGAFYISMYYNSAYYNAANYAYYRPSGTNTNHGICVVGWDDNFDRNKFNSVPAGDGAFICKNSWGASWGQNGYFYISYYDTSFQARAVFTGEPTTNYASVHQYDPLGWIMDYGFGTTTAWGANIFQATAGEPLRAVATYATDANCSYSLYIYTNVTAGNPTSGTLVATQSGTLSSAGYFTIPLSSSVPLTSGQMFSVVFRYQTPSYIYPLPVEEIYSSYSSGATSNPGESFWSSNGSSWTDASARTQQSNLCIKAFTGTTGTQLTISGTVRTATGSGLSGITLNGLPSNPVTPASGAYSEIVFGGWSGTVVPSGSGYTFSPSSRTYTSVVANKYTQDYTAGTGGCTYALSTTTMSFGKTGGTGSVGITAGAGCPWAATSGVGWAVVTSGSSGSGNGTVDFTVSANTSSGARTGWLTVAGQSVAIHQAGEYDFNAASHYIVLPEVIWASATGGGAWVTEVQITDVSGSSAVDVYFNYGGGSRRGPFTVWTNTAGGR
ncbi:MAG: lectin like domain-containing protein, partial [Candidatus Aminicenantes bacterium]|nr:lectin like domain-containing protein [Candidatus Aminicenantes bacterium]